MKVVAENLEKANKFSPAKKVVKNFHTKEKKGRQFHANMRFKVDLRA